MGDRQKCSSRQLTNPSIQFITFRQKIDIQKMMPLAMDDRCRIALVRLRHSHRRQQPQPRGFQQPLQRRGIERQVSAVVQAPS